MTEEHCEGNLIQKMEAFLSTVLGLRQCVTFLRSCEELPGVWHTKFVQLVWTCYPLEFRRGQVSPLQSASPESPNASENQSSERYSFASLYEDMTVLSPSVMEKVVRALIANGVDDKFLARCLLRYLQSAVRGNNNVCGETDRKVGQSDVIETVANLLHSLEWSSVSCRSLFSLWRLVTSLHAGEGSRKQIKEMAGSQLRSRCLYDENLILRLVRKFLEKQVGSHAAMDKIPSPPSGSNSNIALCKHSVGDRGEDGRPNMQALAA